VGSELEEQFAVDGGNGMASVELADDEAQGVGAMAARTDTIPDGGPMTGAELGMRTRTRWRS
jgi:Mn-containing catalase